MNNAARLASRSPYSVSGNLVGAARIQNAPDRFDADAQTVTKLCEKLKFNLRKVLLEASKPKIADSRIHCRQDEKQEYRLRTTRYGLLATCAGS